MSRKYLLVLVLIFGLFVRLNGFILNENENKLEDDDDDEEDYSWDYDEDSEEKPKVGKHFLISLTRDWLGREDPDAYPANGFFPVWAFALLIIAAFFLFLALLTGMLHAFGCRGRRPVLEKSEKRMSAPLIEIPNKLRKQKGGDHTHLGSAHDVNSSRKHSRS